jgi:hypothetical protein
MVDVQKWKHFHINTGCIIFGKYSNIQIREERKLGQLTEKSARNLDQWRRVASLFEKRHDKIQQRPFFGAEVVFRNNGIGQIGKDPNEFDWLVAKDWARPDREGYLTAWSSRPLESIRDLSRHHIDILKQLKASIEASWQSIATTEGWAHSLRFNGRSKLLFYIKYHPKQWRLHVHINPASEIFRSGRCSEQQGVFFPLEAMIANLERDSLFFQHAVLPCLARSEVQSPYTLFVLDFLDNLLNTL